MCDASIFSFSAMHIPALDKRVTIPQMARQLGLHHATVSRALRNHPEIAGETKRRVRELAAQLGYRPDPYLTGLAAYRQAGREAGFAGTLAWITNWPTRGGWRENPVFPQHFRGAGVRAQEQGYRLEEFWLREPGMDARRVLRIAEARGIQGLLFAAQSRPHVRLDMDLSRFSAVTFGHTLESPVLHGVTNHHYQTMIALLKRLHSLGYRRPGIFRLQPLEDRVNRVWTAAFWAYASDYGRRGDTIPPLVVPRLRRNLFLEWEARYRPDVIIASNVETVRRWLEAAGRKIPEDIGLVPPIMSDNGGGFFSGMDENGAVIGAAAVDLLVSMIHRNERGVPVHPQRLLIEGSCAWVEGRSVRKLQAHG